MPEELQERVETAEATVVTAEQRLQETIQELRGQNAELQGRAETAEAAVVIAEQKLQEAGEQTTIPMEKVDSHAARRFLKRMFRKFRAGAQELLQESYEENILWAPEWERKVDWIMIVGAYRRWVLWVRHVHLQQEKRAAVDDLDLWSEDPKRMGRHTVKTLVSSGLQQGQAQELVRILRDGGATASCEQRARHGGSGSS